MQTTTASIQERSSIISITKNLIIENKKALHIKKIQEYGLKQNFFDPSKSSPPNNFMIKLNERICVYK